MIIVTEMFVTERRKGSTVRRPEHLIMTVNAHRIYDPGRATSDVFCSVFNAVSLPALASDLKRYQLNLYTTGELLVLLSQISGDFDSDGDVDGDDFLVWQNGFPTSTGATLLDGDADADGDVDGDDFLMWQNNFPYPAALSSVPEPNSLVLLAMGGLMILRRRRT